MAPLPPCMDMLRCTETAQVESRMRYPLLQRTSYRSARSQHLSPRGLGMFVSQDRGLMTVSLSSRADFYLGRLFHRSQRACVLAPVPSCQSE
jgi:hypothetical protein